MTNNINYVKIIFILEPEDGYPPVGSEAINAIELTSGEFKLDNTPFFIEGVSLGDTVSAEQVNGDCDKYWFKKVTNQSDNKSLSIIFIDAESIENVFNKLKKYGCFCEYGEFEQGALKMLAVNVPSGSDYDQIYNFLIGYEEKEILSFAELAV